MGRNLGTLHLDWIAFLLLVRLLKSPLNTYDVCSVGEKVLMVTNTISTFRVRAVFAL